jgi:hypothetical protein
MFEGMGLFTNVIGVLDVVSVGEVNETGFD